MEKGYYQPRPTGFHNLVLRLIKFLNMALMTCPFWIIWYRYFAGTIAVRYYRRGNWVVVFLYFVIYVLAGRTYDAFIVSYNPISEMVYSQMLAAVITNGIMYFVTWLLNRYVPAVLPFIIVLAVQFVIALFWSVIAHKWYFWTFKPKKTIIVWDMRKGLQETIEDYGLGKKFEVIREMPVGECLADLSVLDEAEAVFLSGVHSHDRNIIIKHCIALGITAFVIPRIGDVLMSGASRMHLFHLPILRLDRYDPNPEYLFIKRFFDILLSLIAIVLLSPVMLITALCIKKEDGGPVFYRQPRMTKDGREFDVLKFRSMRTDAEKDGVARLSTGDHDDRITKVGHVIRKVRIDELPQLFNILGGSMTIVGPRPERRSIAEEYEKELPEFRLRLQAKAGLTGYAQVYGKYNTTPYDKLQMDLMYISNPSIVQDFSIILATIKILFMPESTEGIAEGQTTAAVSSEESEE